MPPDDLGEIRDGEIPALLRVASRSRTLDATFINACLLAADGLERLRASNAALLAAILGLNGGGSDPCFCYAETWIPADGSHTVRCLAARAAIAGAYPDRDTTT